MTGLALAAGSIVFAVHTGSRGARLLGVTLIFAGALVYVGLTGSR